VRKPKQAPPTVLDEAGEGASSSSMTNGEASNGRVATGAEDHDSDGTEDSDLSSGRDHFNSFTITTIEAAHHNRFRLILLTHNGHVSD